MTGGYGLAESCVYVCDGGHDVLVVEREAMEKNGVAVPVMSKEKRTSAEMALFSCGNVLKNPDTHIIIAKDGEACDDDCVGLIYVQSPSVAMGYFPDDRIAFSKTVAGREGVWLDTGDLGFIHEDQLYVCGRQKDLIIIHGKNYYPQDIEYSTSSVPEVKQGSVAAVATQHGDEESLVLVLELHAPLSDAEYRHCVKEICRAVTEDNGLAPSEVVVVAPKSIAKTTSGKISRHRVQEAYEHCTLDVVYRERMTEDDDINVQSNDNSRRGCLGVCTSTTDELNALPSRLDNINTLELHGDELETALLEDVCYLCGVQSYVVNKSDSLEMMGLDSLRRAQLKGVIEQYYGATVDTEFLFDINTTFDQLFYYIDHQINRRPIMNYRLPLEGLEGENLNGEQRPMISQTYYPPERTCYQKFCCIIR